MRAGLPARIAALNILSDVLGKRRPFDTAPEHTDGLEARDAGFARAIASETLRRFGQLDALVAGFVPKPPPPHKAGPALEILLAGACELLFLDVPPHAAVDAANRLAQADAKAVHFKALINAVLRRVAREGKAIVEAQDAARLNTPDWLWTRWTETYGEETTRAIAAAHLAVPPLDIVVGAHGKLASLAASAGAADACRGAVAPLDDHIPPGAPFITGAHHVFGNVWRLDETASVESLPGFHEGRWWVQDAAASLPATLPGDVRGQTVIDLCAAPGGKTMQLAASGARVIAVERESARMERLRENLARTHLAAECVVADARDWRPPQPAQFVLLDAPCSATGTIRRHPELAWIKGAADIAACAAAASELLDAAAEMVAPGGVLVFAVCSLEAEEGPEQVAHFLARHPDFVRAPLAPHAVFGHAEFLTPEGDLRTLPFFLGGMDGFYAARLRRAP